MNVMQPLKPILYSILFLAFYTTGYSQARQVKQETEKKGIIYNNEWSMGVRLLSNGWGFFGERSKILNIYKTRIIQVEFSEIKHRKETKQSSEQSNNSQKSSKDYFFGKQNYFFTLRSGIGIRKVIGEKAEKKGVRVSINYLGGFTLGLLKPYYLNIFYEDPNSSRDILATQRYSEDNEDKFLNPAVIAGSAGFRFGMTEIEPVPGLYGKVSLSFEWGKRDDLVKILEGGIIADFYYKDIPISLEGNNKFYFVAAYISFQFGKRWLK